MITTVILTKNEEAMIADAVANAKLLGDDVLVIDSYSTDNTVVCARNAGARIIEHEWCDDYAAQRNIALRETESKWIFYLDADERLTDEAVQSIKSVIAYGRPALYELTRHNWAFGRYFFHGVLGPDTVKRLFPRTDGFWEGAVHESVKTHLPVIALNGSLTHYTYRDFSQYWEKMNRYSSIWANDHTNKSVNIIKDIFFRPLWAFIKMYILKLGCLDGWLGFVLSFTYANYTMTKYVKLYLYKEGLKNDN